VQHVREQRRQHYLHGLRIFFGHRGQIADINYTFDYIPDGVRRACQLTRVAKTFRWKEP
jgi:hypothetical protein